LPGGFRLVAAFEHEGPARALVHNLKYRGIIWYAEVVAEALAPRLPTIPLVPIPRAWSRQVGYGIDPSRQIASALARRLATPVLDLLRPPLHSKRRAGGDHGIMPRPFRLLRPPETKYQLVDDVVTTGATVMAAARSLGSEQLALVVAANAADRCLVSFK
jgi:predicted amidophosphoribosyltransferase